MLKIFTYKYEEKTESFNDSAMSNFLAGAVELYTHQALSITEVYIDGINRRFDLKKRECDPWSEK